MLEIFADHMSDFVYKIWNGGKIQIFAWVGGNKFFFANIMADIKYMNKVIKGKRCKKSFSKTFASKTFSNFDSFSCKLQ